MSGWSAAVLVLLFVTNAPGVSHQAAWGDRSSAPWRRQVLEALAAATLVLAAVGLLTGPILDAIDLSTPTFRLGTSLVVGITGGRWFLTPPPPVDDVADATQGRLHLLIALLPPGPVLAAMAANADAGAAAGLVAVAVTAAVSLAFLYLRRLNAPTGTALTRLLGGLTLVAAVAIGIDSARTV